MSSAHGQVTENCQSHQESGRLLAIGRRSTRMVVAHVKYATRKSAIAAQLLAGADEPAYVCRRPSRLALRFRTAARRPQAVMNIGQAARRATARRVKPARSLREGR